MFELILIDKSVGPQESGQRAVMQCVVSAGGGGGRGGGGWAGWRARADRLVDEYHSNVSFRFVLVFQSFHTFFVSYV